MEVLTWTPRDCCYMKILTGNPRGSVAHENLYRELPWDLVLQERFVGQEHILNPQNAHSIDCTDVLPNLSTKPA